MLSVRTIMMMMMMMMVMQETIVPPKSLHYIPTCVSICCMLILKQFLRNIFGDYNSYDGDFNTEIERSKTFTI